VTYRRSRTYGIRRVRNATPSMLEVEDWLTVCQESDSTFGVHFPFFSSLQN